MNKLFNLTGSKSDRAMQGKAGAHGIHGQPGGNDLIGESSRKDWEEDLESAQDLGVSTSY